MSDLLSAESTKRGARIFFRAWSHNRPTGGQKQMYRHVDILNSGGFDAYILHDKDDFRLSWFDNDTRVVGPTGFNSLYRNGDVLVLPEDVGRAITRFPGHKVIFNQNIYHGYVALGDTLADSYPYQAPDLLGVISVSAHNEDNLIYAFPKARVFRVFYGIDQDRFKPVCLNRKRPMIATILKGDSSVDIQALFHMLNARAKDNANSLKGFEWRFIANNTEEEVADILRKSVLFLFLSSREGFPILPLEAMASGCILATLDVDPLREYVPAECRFRPGDLVRLARWIETVAASRTHGYADFEELVSRCRAVASQYDLKRERDSVLSIWRDLLS